MAEHRVSNSQLDELLDFLEANPLVAKGVGMGSRSKVNIEREWDNIAAKLNAHSGGSSKTGMRWKRYWADLKHKVKNRAAEKRREAEGTGDWPSTLDDLSESDKRVLAIIAEITVFGDTEHIVPAFPTATSNSNTPMKHQTREVNGEEIEVTAQIKEEYDSPYLTYPFTRGNTSRVAAQDTPSSSYNNRHELPPQPDVNTEWAIELERRRVAAEEKNAEAALITANALNSFVELSRMHMEAMHKILDLLNAKNNNE